MPHCAEQAAIVAVTEPMRRKIDQAMKEQETELRGRTHNVTEEQAAEAKQPAAQAAVIDPATDQVAPVTDRSADADVGDGAASVATGGATEVESLKVEREQLLDRLARLQAEFDNARKRAEREQIEFRDYAIGNVVEKFLPVMDNFQLALQSTGSAEQLRSGVELIVKQMEEVLRGMQVAAIPTVGEQFDPRVHEALGSVERNDVPDHQVVEEVRRGYKVRERLLRPAMVRVAHNPRQVHE